MKNSIRSFALTGLIAALVVFPIGSSFADDPKFTAKYDVWISPNHGHPPVSPPYVPYHDCLVVNHYGGTNWDVLLESCPPAGAAWVRPGTIEAFGGRTCHIYLLGWYINSAAFPWADRDTIGGVMGSLETQHSWGFEGVRNDECHAAP